MSKASFVSVFIMVSVLAAGFYCWPALAYVMQSSNYRLQQDSINFSGGKGESNSYLLEDAAGEVGSGMSTSTSFALNAGYEQADGVLSLAVYVTTTLSPSIAGVSGGIANTDSVVVVGTTAQGGYTLYINASTTPAMLGSGENFANYTTAGADLDYAWGVSSTDSEFGYTAEGPHIAARFMDNGSACGSGSGDTPNTCWDGFSTSNEIVSQTNYGNGLEGTTTTIKFRAEVGNRRMQATGIYTAGLTITAVTN